MKVLAELLRIVFIFLFGGVVVWVVLGPLYSIHPRSEQYQWIGGLGVYAVLFVLYRNRWQFSGWYDGKGKKKLPPVLTIIILWTSLVLIAFPMFLIFA